MNLGDFGHPPYGGITPTKPFSLRLTFEERTALEQLAGDMPLGTYIRKQIFENAPSSGPGGLGTKPRRRKKTRNRNPIKDQTALGQLMGELGKAKLANNLNQLAKAVNTGSLPVTPEVEHEIHIACEEVKWMREILIKAMGLKTDADKS